MDFSYEPNGNIKKARWKVTHHNVKFYQYAYDALNRLTNAEYGDIYLEENPANGTLSYQELLTNTYKGYGYSYDAIGNLLTLNRYGVVGGPDCEWGIIDQLSYTYDSQIAHLTNVADAAPLPGRDKGFKPKPGAGAYLYDDNGNMRIDPHKDLTITYNFLNLPSQIVKSGAGGGGTLSFTYDAMGRKWRKQGAGETRDYCQGIEYKDGKLEAVYGPEGRLTAVYDQYGVSLTHYRAEYWLRDHLGNTRLAFSDENHDGAIDTYDNPNTPENESEVVQENHYYPFGLNHEGPWYGGIGPENKYQYNGKELNEDFGLNWYDFGARWQDPAIGRWWQVDPLAEMYAGISPYAYVANNPLKFIDPDGKRIDVESETKNNGREKVTITYTGVVENEGASLSRKDIRQLTKMIKKQLESSFSGSGDNVTWKTKVNLRVLGKGEKAGADDNRIVLTNSSNPNLNGRTGAAPNGFDAYIDTEGRRLGDIAKTAAHEVGHNMGLPHNVQDIETIIKETAFGTLNTPVFLQSNTIQPGHPAAGNLMLPGTQVDAAGTNITPSQIRHILQDFRAGKLNSRTISGGDDPFGIYPTDKPIVNIYGKIIRD